MTFNPTTHNGSVTIFNPKTGGHRTFRIRTETWDKDKPPVRVLSVLAGSDNVNDYQNFGFVTDSGIAVWKRFRKEERFEKFATLLSNIERGEEFGLEYKVEGRCRACNRKLTNPESIDSGIGPICAGKKAVA